MLTVSDFIESYQDQISQIFQRLGAPIEQADVMASQLLKRAEQIAEREGITKVNAVEGLLKKVIEAREEP